jgi:hypothetical protein
MQETTYGAWLAIIALAFLLGLVAMTAYIIVNAITGGGVIA